VSRGEGQWFTLPLPAAPGDFAAASLGDAPSHRAQARSYRRPFSTLFHRDFERTMLPIKMSVRLSKLSQSADGCAVRSDSPTSSVAAVRFPDFLLSLRPRGVLPQHRIR
jgi:hypothetical protein